MPLRGQTAPVELLIEFVQHDVRQQGRKRAALGSSLHGGTDQTVNQHARSQERTDETQDASVRDARGQPSEKAVVVDAVEEFRQVKVNDVPVPRLKEALRMPDGLLCGPSGAEPIAGPRSERVLPAK